MEGSDPAHEGLRRWPEILRLFEKRAIFLPHLAARRKTDFVGVFTISFNPFK